MRNMKKMRRPLLIFAIFGLLTTFIVSCGSDKSNSDTREKISFPIIEFVISANSDTTVFGKQGTRLFIGKETFQYTDGTPVTDSIKIELREFYKKSDIALADLSTESDGKLLETGGMLNITATSKGQEIEIKSDKRIVVHFPKSKDNYNQMNLFFADKNSNDSLVKNWNIDTVNLLKQVAKLGAFGYQWVTSTDSTEFEFRPRNYVDTGYYWNPIDFYVNTYPFTASTLKEINSCNDQYGVATECIIDKNGRIKNPQVKSKIEKSAANEILKFIHQLPILEPGKNEKGEIVERLGLLDIKTENIRAQKTDAEYIKSFNSKYKKYEKSPIRNVDDAELNYFVFSVSKLGWINCDRFLESEKTVDYFVQIPTDKNTKIKMVFKDINGILMATSTDEKFVFSKVPIGRQVTIVAIKNTNGQFQTAFQEVTISNKSLEALAFKETRFPVIRA